jgi:sugar lactone lactonase YvrE
MAVVGVSSAQEIAPTLLRPSGIAYDAVGDLFVADADRNQVLEITLAGNLTIVAGSGVQGFAGDGGPPTAAQLNAPQGVTVATDGTIYIADTGNQRIRVMRSGEITTFAGGAAGFSGDGGPASAAMFNQPVAVAMDPAGNLLICDRGNQRIRRVSGGVVSTMAGNGIEGFSGDGGAAVVAELNEPSGIAVGPDGRVFVADTANHRVRVVTADGKIATFAGTGVAGSNGDGGQAITAQLNHPQAVTIDAEGAVYIADQNNQRLRQVGTDGRIVTIAGSGAQGASADGTSATAALLNLPAATAISSFGWPLIAEPLDHTLRVMLDDGKLYELAGLSSWISTLTPAIPDATYGAAQASLSVASRGGTARGTVQIFDGSAQVGQAVLAQGMATLPLPNLAAGTHTLTSVYGGDGVHPAATASSALTISPAPVVASATTTTVSYGAPLPTLSGTLAGVLAQDAGSVTAVFSVTGLQMPSVGSYPIAASLNGPASGNYAVSLSPGSGSLTVVPAASIVTLSPPANAYAGLPLQLSAQVVSTTRGVPTGSVEFLDGGVSVASATLVNGSATAIDLAPVSGSHTLVAAYSGDQNFTPSDSANLVASVAAMPDFGLSISGSSKQVVLAGSTANYALTIASQSSPFTGVVTLSANGLPAGASASFSPPAVVPGAEAAAVTMTIITAASQARLHSLGRSVPCLLASALLLPLVLVRRRPPWLSSLCLSITMGLVGLSGCGARTASESALPVQTFVVTVKATSTNLAGNIVVHSAEVTLGLE